MSWTQILMALAAVIVVVLGACGGDDETTEAATDATTAPADNDSGEQPEADESQDEVEESVDDAAEDAAEGGTPSPDDFDFGTGVARVTIGDTTYEFDLTTGFTVCQDVFGGLQVAGDNASGDANVDMWIPPTDWETYTDGRYDPPAIIVEDDSINVRWIADPNRVELISDWPPESRVDSYTKNDTAASGSATFVDDYAIDNAEPIEGTFEVACES